ncbi:Uncharacterised protein [Streptococcus pyogenes]|nr:hypothetical protein [Streptococcus pyogenes]RXS26083.1 hypothetical protein ER611_08250 [Streptococcus pyogenes]VGR88660.1 Uncharacterised protein [Streptococcus pyogenes]VGS75456.1 Uncharacterised protein [Streptococcus pyogenes]VGT60444.1 Uncharacterised protein [Streptococcus pyogenes]VGT82220.1 Uncharacterised protein [Streptococcus pyogenes]
MTYIKAELFRFSKIRGLKIFLITILLIIIAGNGYFLLLNPYQDKPFILNDLFYGFFMLSMMGLYLIFPLITSTYSSKTDYINQQITLTKLSSIKVYLIDSFNAFMLSSFLFSIWTLMIIVISNLLFNKSSEFLPNSIGLDLKNFLIIQIVLLITIGLSSVQAISFQKIFKNNILATSFFILTNYVLAIIFLQLRYFSNILEKLTYLFPMSLVSYFYK